MRNIGLVVIFLLLGLVWFQPQVDPGSEPEPRVQAVVDQQQPSRNSLVKAKFKVPRISRDDELDFEVTLTNNGDSELTELSVVASAGRVVSSSPVPALPPGESTTVAGVLLLGEETGSFEFTARVLGPGISQRSVAVTVARPEGLGGPAPSSSSLVSYAQPQQKVLRKGKGVSDTPQQFGETPQELAFAGELESVAFENDVNHLVAQVEDRDCEVSRKVLEIYRDNGNQRADRYLLGHL